MQNIIWKGKHKEEENEASYTPFSISHQELSDIGVLSHWEIDTRLRKIDSVFNFDAPYELIERTSNKDINYLPTFISFDVSSSYSKSMSFAASVSFYSRIYNNSTTNKYGFISHINSTANNTHVGFQSIINSGVGTNNGFRTVIAGGTGSTNYGVYAEVSGGTTSWAGYFIGDVSIKGNQIMESSAARNIRFANNCGNTGGIVFGGTDYTAYNSRIMDDGNLHILTDDALYIGDINTSTGAKGTLPFAFDVDNGRLTITSSYASGSGNGILQVNGSTTGQTIIGINNTSAGGHSFEILSTGSAHALGAGHFGIYDLNNGFMTFRVDSSGYVHIGSRSYFYIEKTDAADHTALQINTSTNRVTRATSSRRYKKNIKDYQFDLDKIDLLRAKQFRFKSDDSRGISYIAEDVAEIYPEMSIHDANGLVENYSDKKMETLLAEEIKDLRKRVKQLEGKQ